MKKILIISIILVLISITGLMTGKFYIERKMAQTITNMLDHMDTKYLSVTYDTVDNACWFSPCLIFKNVQVRLFDKNLTGGDVLMKMSLFPTWLITIQTQPEQHRGDFGVNAAWDNNTFYISKAFLMQGQFSGTFTGGIDLKNNHVNITVQTIGLKDFIMPAVPASMHSFLNWITLNTPQQISIKDHEGWLTIQGIPFIRLAQ